MDWGFIRSEIGDKPIQDVEGGRHLTYNDVICIGDYIADIPIYSLGSPSTMDPTRQTSIEDPTQPLDEIHSSEPPFTVDPTCQTTTEDLTQPLDEIHSSGPPSTVDPICQTFTEDPTQPLDKIHLRGPPSTVHPPAKLPRRITLSHLTNHLQKMSSLCQRMICLKHPGRRRLLNIGRRMIMAWSLL